MSVHVTFAPVDYALVALYFAFLVGIGISTARRRRRAGVAEDVDYMVAGRTLTLPAFVATLVATWYGGILGVGEMSYTTGLATWTIMGLPYYLFAIVYALFLAKRVRGASLLTIPDTIEAAYGKPCALIGAVLVFGLVTPASYTLMLGTLLHMLFGWPLLPALLIGTTLSVGFVITGGFRNDVRTNILQFLLMFSAFAMVLCFAMAKHGGVPTLAAHLPPALKAPGGGLPWPYILVWYFIALWTLVDPGFHQRCSAARNGGTARRGILISVICWAVFDFMTISTGLYARSLLPHLAHATESYPALSQILLPAGAKGFFWVGMMAPVMSALLSDTFIGAITLGRDIVWRALPGERNRPDRDVWWTRIGVVLTSALSVLAALKLPSVVSLWYTIGTAFIPGLLLPLMTSYAPRLRIPSSFMTVAMLLGTALPMLWLVAGARAGSLDSGPFPLGIQPMYTGLGATLIIWILGRLMTMRRAVIATRVYSD